MECQIMYLKNNLKILRSKKGLSYRQMGKKCGIGYASINRLENEDDSNVKIHTLKKLADFFNITIDELVYKDLSKDVPVTGTKIKDIS
ncbi:XRE family transcriptional regulator [Coprobacillus cateniformis]|nr:XRE family transcriptional regulator [Coprobacillus cateniformis]RGO25876.1 XRE family transcriptional regulator [Coprobacillus cateniformis]